MRSIGELERWVKLYDQAVLSLEDFELGLELFELQEFSQTELQEAFDKTLAQLEDLEFNSTMNEEADELACLLKINAGAGGTESCDWASMLFRMYVMWAQRKGYPLKVLHQQEGEVAGIKSAVLEINAPYTYGLLRGENGVHRLVRPSPFNAQGKRQTSFVSVFVYPLVDDRIEINVNPADLEWDTFRASGAGGQHINKTESAVRVRHKPSGIVVECQEDRSQHINREKALTMLRSELYKLEVDKRNEAKAKIEEGKMKIEWGSQIRSYVLDDRRIKDHRSGYTCYDTKKILDGDLDDMFKATLMAEQFGRVGELEEEV